MTKKLIQHGNSAALVIEKPILQLLNIDMNTNLEIITDGKNIIISPTVFKNSEKTVEDSLDKINKKYSRTLKKLSE